MLRALAVVCALALAACAGPAPPAVAPGGSGAYKVGEPYRVAGKWYYPKEDLSYNQVGIASWYGPGFHGKSTANGEKFDMNRLTAAHKTLPLPSAVRVTNLDNGRSLVLRVNDRGPFVDGRLIDVSRRAAQLLGFAVRGTARVRVEILPQESHRLAALAQRGIAAEPDQTAPERVAAAPRAASGLFVQVGTYSELRAAERVAAGLAGPVQAVVYEVAFDGQRLYRVRLGPLASPGQADAVLEHAAERGYRDARLVSE